MVYLSDTNILIAITKANPAVRARLDQYAVSIRDRYPCYQSGLNLETAVGRACQCRDRHVRQGVRTRQANACKDEQVTSAVRASA